MNIYGSREVFVSEYRNLLADRLLQSLAYDTSREVSLQLLSVEPREIIYLCTEQLLQQYGNKLGVISHLTMKHWA